MSFKTSMDEYTTEEIQANGNGLYGGKRHDEICDYLQNGYKLSDEIINHISVGIWLAIESERAISKAAAQEWSDEVHVKAMRNFELVQSNKELKRLLLCVLNESIENEELWIKQVKEAIA